MSTRNSRGSSDAASSSDSAAASMNMMADLQRRQFAMLSRSASALYRASEAVRQLQLNSAQRASQQNQEAAERLRDSRDLSEMMAIQNELLRFNLQESANYWQQLTTAVLRIQSEMISGAGEVLDPGAEPTLDALQRAFAATLNVGASAGTTTHH
jgi:hypothetical protein